MKYSHSTQLIFYLLLGKTPSAMYYCASQVRGDVCYLAPEVLGEDDRHITTSADMWSLGAVISYIANEREHLFRTAEDVFRWIGDKSPIRRQFNSELELDVLVLSLLSIDKHDRPSAKEVLEEQNETRQELWRET